jgi:hypothetical protein
MNSFIPQCVGESCDCCSGTGVVDVCISETEWELQVCEDCGPVMYPFRGLSEQEYLEELLKNTVWMEEKNQPMECRQRAQDFYSSLETV